MAVNVKPADRVVAKYAARAAVAQPEYIAGVTGAGQRWEQASTAADANYRQAVTAAASAGRFSAGIRAAGASKYETNATRKGPGRFVEGVQLGQGDYAQKINTVLQTIAGLTLPARGPTGSAQNFQRIQPIGEALRRAFGKTATAR